MTKIESVKAISKDLDESTSASWFWCLIFGPLWFAFIGSWKWFFIAVLVNIATLGVGFFIMPFFAYKAHRDVADAKAVQLA